MPIAPTYPGVYIEEIPSGVHAITGVATSITAFLGRAARGEVDDPLVINSWADFERYCGGLDRNYPASYAVRDFFLNGGSQGLFVRIFKDENAKPSSAKLVANGLSLQATSPGSWGNNLQVRIDNAVSADVATRFGLTSADLFNLSVRDAGTNVVETYFNLTIKDSPNRADRVLKNNSNLLQVNTSAWPPANVPTPHPAPPSGRSVWDDSNNPPTFSKVATGDQAGDGLSLTVAADFIGDQNNKTKMYALEKADLFNLLCIPEDTIGGGVPTGLYNSDPLTYCVKRRAMLLVDPPPNWSSVNTITASNNQELTNLGISGDSARNAALFFPRVQESDPKLNGQPDTYVPCGAVAGIMARTDAQRGVWKAPAGIEAALNGIVGLSVPLTEADNGMVNPLAVNCLRTFPVYGSVVWGARTLRGADVAVDDYKYIPVRRLALYLEESLYRGTQWVVFEPNDEPLWSQIRLNVGAFMHTLFRQGAFQGTTPQQAYFVKCDKETTTQNDIDRGIVNILVGFAPLKPAEFVVIQIQQIAGQMQT